MTCKLCLERGKAWPGSDPQCAFESGVFSPQNWMCATACGIRDICYEGQQTMPPGVDYQYCEDQKYATIKVDHLSDFTSLALWLTWYKNRGATEGMWLLSTGEPPRLPTEADCLEIICAYRPKATTVAI